ncbi:hypothetical protein Dip518_000350 [Parelusimicrobium proximum]|uniref:hypothetical protein n=1 Tax=Parelusimicrobium proximum TaxID=3228953 RepID=UPI003D182855
MKIIKWIIAVIIVTALAVGFVMYVSGGDEAIIEENLAQSGFVCETGGNVCSIN